MRKMLAMIGLHRISVLLTAAMPPAPIEDAPKPARSLKKAIANLDREAELLLAETRACYPIHETLQELAARI